MRRGAKPAKSKLEAELAVLRRSLKNEAAARRQAETRLAEALEQQTATGEILQVISSTPTALQPVLDAVAEKAARVCGARDAIIYRLEVDVLRQVAAFGTMPKPPSGAWTHPIDRGSVTGRAVVDRTTIHVHDMAAVSDTEFPDGKAYQRRWSNRTTLSTPLLREGIPIGAITINRTQVSPFSDKQIRLLELFAAQAVIAIENARLFAEAQARNRDLTEFLEQQTATGEILRVISSSPTDAQPVFDAIVRSAVRLCGGLMSCAFRFDGELIHFVAHHNFTPEGLEAYRRAYPLPPARDKLLGRALLEGRVVNVDDILKRYRSQIGQVGLGHRSVVAVPMLREGTAIGAIAVSRTETGFFPEKQIDLLKTFADQAVIAIENVRLFQELEASNRVLTETLEQQTATAEILRAISGSPTDIQPVLDTVARAAARFCGATDVLILRLDGATLRGAAGVGQFQDVLVRQLGSLPALELPVTRGSVTGRAVVEKRTVHVHDLGAVPEDDFPEGRELQSRFGHRTMVATPLLREGTPLGAIDLFRMVVEPFSDKQLELLRVFADQAVIAIENVRLFTELRDRNAELRVALEQQTATSDLLKTIGRSTFDLQPVFEMLAENAVRLCEAERGMIFRFDGQRLRVVATHNISPELRAFVEQNPITPGRHTVAARAALERGTIHIQDVMRDPEYTYGAKQVDPHRTVLGVPMLRAGELLGVILIYRHEVRPFTDGQIALVETFADQAAIAIENVRLFTELGARNRDLTETLEQQTATSEVLKVISRSAFELQPVFETLAENAVRLCQAERAFIFRFDGELLRAAAAYNVSLELREFVDRNPIAPGRHSVSARAALERRTVHVPDIQADPEYAYAVRDVDLIRTILAVPMLKGDDLVGTITIYKVEVRPFTDKQIALVETFADQAVIAIENVRLFQELEARTGDLTRSVGELRALGEVSQAVSSTLDLETVLETIVSRAVELSGSDSGLVYEFAEATQSFHARATHRITPEHLGVVRAAPIRLGEGAVGRAGVIREPVTVANIADEEQFVAPQTRALLIREGLRSLLAVPLVREDRVLGGLVILRREIGGFSPEVVSILQTFAAQSVLAIHNARLFREIQRQKQYSEALVETSPVAIATMDLRGTILGWNPAAERLFGWTAAEAVGRDVDDLVAAPEAREEARRVSGRTLSGERVRAITQRHRKDGSPIDVEVSSVPIVVDGAEVGFIAIYHDITELLRARREAEAANEAKSAFLATMSHEIRTPMNAVIGMSGLLLNTPLTDEQRDYAEIVRQSGDALLTVINDILDFSKIEAGKLELESQPFDLRECVESALDLVAPRAAEKGLDLAYLIGDGAPAAIVGDVTRLRQILLNLLSNAVKFTEQGEVVLSVSARRLEGAAALHELAFSVRDTGIGIAADRLGRLFQSFSQVDASTTRRYGGTGLGLAISQRLTELMGGRIGVTSELGTGSEFRFTIRAATAGVPAATRRDLSGVQPSLRGKDVLVVDDNATNRRILTAHLGAWGMRARATGSPVEALDWIRAGGRFDAGILDMHMPEMDGVALARAIREHAAGTAFPLILFTSLGRREARAEDGGFAAYLNKPIKPSQLFDALISVLAERPVHVRERAVGRSELDPDTARRHPLRILLAEDNVVNQKVALRLLAQLGYRADVVANGLEAIDAVERQTYDVVLMDVQMPELDGFEASREITRRWTGVRRPRIVAMTANAMQGDRELCQAAGMDDYVSKPVRVEELVAALERCRGRPETRPRGAPAADVAASEVPAGGAIDRPTFDRLTATMGGPFVAELIDTFGEDARELIATLRRALAATDLDAFRRTAHSLKSNAETLGATALATLARELEAMARAGSLDGTADRVERLAGEYQVVARALGELRHGLSA